MWFDVPQEFDRDEGSQNVQVCRTLQSDILVNNRAGGGCGDYNTPEQRIGGFDMERPWETCMTICRQWAWKPDDTMKTLPQCLQNLIRSAGGDGNLLFNVGPTSEGEIELRQVERLKEMGQWLAKYGETIYGTRGGPYKTTKNVACTRKGNMVYLHVLAWPEDVLKLPPLPAKIVKSCVLTGGKVDITTTEAGLEISVPKDNRQEIDTIVAMEIDKSALDIAPIPVSTLGQSLTEGKRAKASNVFRNSSGHGPAKALDDDEETRWATDADVKQCWLEVDLGKPETFDRALLDECIAFGVRVKRFELQAREGKEWKTFFQGTAMGRKLEVRFPPVTAQHVRLNIDGEHGPTINEFQLFAPAPPKSK